MKYEDWIENLKKLDKSNNEEILKQFEMEPINEAIKHNISEKIIETLTNRNTYSINKIINNLEFLFDDINELDLMLINFKKEVNFTMRLASLKQIEEQELIYENIKKEINEVYNILVKNADIIDRNGTISNIIINNKIKWSD